MHTMTITVQAETEEELYPLLNHAFREATEIDYRNYDVEINGKYNDGWLEVMGKLKGKYKWAKLKSMQ